MLPAKLVNQIWSKYRMDRVKFTDLQTSGFDLVNSKELAWLRRHNTFRRLCGGNHLFLGLVEDLI